MIRSGEHAPGNITPFLLVDDARYALGISAPGKEDEAKLMHNSFVNLTEEAYEATKASFLRPILVYLHQYIDRENLAEIIKPNDVVTFGVGELPYPFERRELRAFWLERIGRACSSDVYGQCSVCGKVSRLLRKLPVSVTILGQKCQIVSFNWGAAESFGRKQTVNAQICAACGMLSAHSLNYLLENRRHCAIIARDSSKGTTKNTLDDQVAVFWLEEEPDDLNLNGTVIDTLELLSSPLQEGDNPYEVMTLRLLEELLARPWTGRDVEASFEHDSFHLVVLSANTGRLVVREYMDTSLPTLFASLSRYMDGLRIVSPSGDAARAFSIPATINALRVSSPELIRRFVGAAYLAHDLPSSILERAVNRMSVSVHATKDDPYPWRNGGITHVIAAVIKLVLTLGSEEAKTMEQLNRCYNSSGYLCGRLLAILEEAQKRAANNRLNSTLVEKYIGAASVSPEAILPRLIRLAESGHLPKIRREYREYTRISRLLQEITVGIDENGGFPTVLSLRGQGEFMLGFYHQRAEFEMERRRAREKKQMEQMESRVGTVEVFDR